MGAQTRRSTRSAVSSCDSENSRSASDASLFDSADSRSGDYSDSEGGLFAGEDEEMPSDVEEVDFAEPNGPLSLGAAFQGRDESSYEENPFAPFA